MKAFAPLIFSSALLLTGCSNSTLSQLNMPAEQSAQAVVGYYARGIDPMIHQYMQEKQVSGMVVAVIQHNGPAEFHSYGVTDSRHQYPITPDTLFALGSLSKGVTAEITTVLVNQGVLHWNDTLAQLLPADTPLSDDARKITLLQLATHTSGLPRQPMDLLTLENLLRYFSSGENFYTQLGNDTVLTSLADFTAPEGTRAALFQYRLRAARFHRAASYRRVDPVAGESSDLPAITDEQQQFLSP